MSKLDKLSGLISAIRTARTFEGAMQRSNLTKRQIMATMKDPEILDRVSQLSGRKLTYHQSQGYVSSGNSRFRKQGDLRSEYRPAWISIG